MEMTHDELRDLVDKYDCAGMVNKPVVAALRAVVELHKPATATSFTNNDCLCMLPNRKCATIEAIEKELA